MDSTATALPSSRDPSETGPGGIDQLGPDQLGPDQLVVTVLGPIGARRNGESLELGGARQRRLLAALVIDAGQVVASDRLAERVWSDTRPPDDPRGALRNVVNRLRQALGATVVVTEATGYRLATGVGAAVVDRDRFVALVSRADDLSVGLGERLAILDDALALWRGPAFAEVAEEWWARPAAEQLEELRITAVERRFGAMLDAGKHTDAVPGLAGAEAFPLRDRLVGLQMLALYRSGRQSEASRVYQAHRARLAAELGLAPGSEIVDLDRKILVADPTLDLPPDAPIGRQLRGYRLGERVGEGAFAVVFRGTQPSVGRDVAVKVIRAELANRPEFVRRFEAEAHLVARLEHPHIVPLYDYWREPGRAFLVLRYLRGGTLEARLTGSGGGGLPLADLRSLVTQIGAALGAAHRAGVVHRDVKPANVFCDETGNFYLGDFGIALVDSDPFDPTNALSAGSPAYASPEQLRREPVGPAADVHGFGITLYEACTGRLPFPDALTYAELLQRQLSHALPSVREVRRDVPAVLDEVLARATAKAPGDRYGDVGAFVDAVLVALDGSGGVGANAFGVASVSRRAAATAMTRGDERNPYKGLRPFTEADAGDFRGRARLVGRLVAELARTDGSARIAAVVGPSGIGKSSVVRAGLLPALRRGAVPGAADWFVATMLPGVDPFEELAACLLRVATRVPENLMGQLTEDHRGLARIVKAIAPDRGEVLLAIDQFEELFTLCDDDLLRRRFLDALEYAVTDARCPLRVVLTMRADFYDRPLRHASFARLIENSTIPVMALAPDELEAAIVEPALAAGCEFEPGLVSEIVADVGDQPGALPLLQYALTELYEQRISGLLTTDAYRRIGGVPGALTARAEQLASTGTAAEQDALRRLFGRLVTFGDGSEDTRRRVQRSELGADEATSAVIERFGAARLLSFDRDPGSREPTVEVAHEALLRQWPRLRTWLEEDRDGLRVHRHLTDAAAAWERSGRDDGELYRGGRLEAARDWLGVHDSDPNPLERVFLDTSVRSAEANRSRELRAARRLRRALLGVGLVAAMALLAGALAFQQRGSARAAAREAGGQRDVARDAAFAAETGRLAALAPTLAETDLSLSMLLGVEAVRRSESPESLGALQRSFVAADSALGFLFSDEPLRGVFVDGDRIVGVGESSVVRWDATTHARIDVTPLGTAVRDAGTAIPTHPVSYAAGVVAWVGIDGLARVLTLGPAARADVVAEGADAVALDATAARLAVAYAGGGTAVVTRDGLRPVWQTPADGIATFGEAGLPEEVAAFGAFKSIPTSFYLGEVAFSPDGTTVIRSRAGWLNWLDAATGERRSRSVTAIRPTESRVTNVNRNFAFSASGDRLFLSGVSDLAMYDAGTATLRSRFESPLRLGQNRPIGLAGLPDGTVAVLGSAGELVIVDPKDGRVVQPAIDARVGTGSALRPTADGRSVLVAGSRGIAIVAVDGGGLLRSAAPLTMSRPVLGSSPDARWVNAWEETGASADATRAVEYWMCDPATGCAAAVPFPWLEDTVSWPDVPMWVELRLGPPTTLRLRDLDGGAARSPWIDLEFANGLGGQTILDPDGEWVLVWRWVVDDRADPPGVLQVNRVSSGERIATVPIRETGGRGFALRPTDKQILTFPVAGGKSTLVDPATWTERPSGLPDGAVVAASFSIDGRWLVTSDVRGDVALRHGDTFEEVRKLSSVGGANRGAFAFSDDGRYLVGSQDGKGRLWDVASGQLVGRPIGGLPTASTWTFYGKVPGFVTATSTHLQVWWFDPSGWADIACKAAGRNLTAREWALYGPRDLPYRPTCPQWPAGA